VYTPDGRCYLDTTMALGTTILGYSHPSVIEAVCSTVRRTGGITSGGYPLEGSVIELLGHYIPTLEKGIFLINGSDAVNAGVRLARRASGRPVVLVCGSYGEFRDPHYHGWSDWLAVAHGEMRGVPRCPTDTIDFFNFNDLVSLDEALDRHLGHIAAIVMEGLKFDPPAEGFLAAVQDRARAAGIYLIFDETVHGFRLTWGGAHQQFGISPDLICLGKAIGSGFPVAVLGGGAALMDLVPEVRVSLTFAAAPFVLAAVYATAIEVARQSVIQKVQTAGMAFQERLASIIKELGLEQRIRISGYGGRFVLRLLDTEGRPSQNLSSMFALACARKGVLAFDVHNICLAHRESDLSYVSAVYREIWETFPW
jgi:glutamate-1-semialdehyde 2,1-aminomutase